MEWLSYKEYQESSSISGRFVRRSLSEVTSVGLEESLRNADRFHRPFPEQNAYLQEIHELHATFEHKQEVIQQNIRQELIESLTAQAKECVYKTCKISETQSENSTIKNFLKGILDELIFSNIDLVAQIVATSGKIILDIVKALLSWRTLYEIAKSLGESIGNLFVWDAYEKGKSIAEFAGWVVGMSKRVAKSAIKHVWKWAGDIPKTHIASTAHASDTLHTKTPERISFQDAPKRLKDTVEDFERIGFSPEMARYLEKADIISSMGDQHTLLQRFAYYEKQGIDIHALLEKARHGTSRKLSTDERLLAVLSTDGMMTAKLNHAVQNISTITDKQQRIAIEEIQKTLTSAYKQRPPLEGKLFVRADGVERKLWSQPLERFTFVTTDSSSTFLSDNAKNLIELHGNYGKVFDLSDISLWVQFWQSDIRALTKHGELNIMKLPCEGVLLPDTHINIIDIIQNGAKDVYSSKLWMKMDANRIIANIIP